MVFGAKNPGSNPGRPISIVPGLQSIKPIGYKSEFGEYCLPPGLKEELTGKSIGEQMKYFGSVAIYLFAIDVGGGNTPSSINAEDYIFKLDRDE